MLGGIGSVLTVNTLVACAIVVGLANNVLVAAAFGLTRRVDAFFAAMVLPSLFMILCVDYLGKNFLPLLAVAKREGEASASRMTSTVITLVFLFAAMVTAFLVVFGGFLFGLLLPGFGDAEIELVQAYFTIMAPAIVLMAVNAFHEYVCQYDEMFSTVVAVRIALPVMNLVSILALGPVLGEYCLPVGYLLGHVTVFALMARCARYRFVPCFDVRPHLERKVFVNSAIVMSTGFISRTRSIVINAIGSTLGGGAISALALATKLTEPLERCAFTGAKMLMFSRTARLHAERNEQELGRAYSISLRVGFLILTPLLWWIGLNSQAIVMAFFGRGEFTEQMGVLVGAALVGMVPAVLLQGLNQVLANAFYATGRVWLPTVIMPLGMLVFVAVSLPLSGALGTQGLALAISVMSLVVFIALLVSLSRVLDGLDLWRTSGHLCAYAALAGGAMTATSAVLQGPGLSSAAVALIGLPVGAIAYLGVLAMSGDRTLASLRRYARNTLVAAGRSPA